MRVVLVACVLGILYTFAAAVTGATVFKTDNLIVLLHGIFIPIIFIVGTTYLVVVRQHSLPRKTTLERKIRLIPFPNKKPYSLIKMSDTDSDRYLYAYRNIHDAIVTDILEPGKFPVEFQYLTDNTIASEIYCYVTVLENPKSWWVFYRDIIFDRKYVIHIARESVLTLT